MDYNILITFLDFSVLAGEVDCFQKELFGNRWLKIDNVEINKTASLLVRELSVPLEDLPCTFP